MFKTILVAYDGSDHADKAAALAEDLAEKYGAAIHLVTVVDHANVPDAVSEFAAAERVDSPKRLEEHAYDERLLRPLAKRMQAKQGIGSVHTTVLRGEPAPSLIAHADAIDSDLIVTGRRGLGRMDGLLLGSVSAKLTSHAACPVMTVK